MVSAKSDYNDNTKKLLTARYKNARLFWKMLKDASGVKQSNISLSTFERYFKAVNNPEDRFFIPDDDVLHFIDRYERNEFRVLFDELNLQLSLDEINKSINQLKNGRSGGPDLVVHDFFFISGKDACYIYYTNK